MRTPEQTQTLYRLADWLKNNGTSDFRFDYRSFHKVRDDGTACGCIGGWFIHEFGTLADSEFYPRYRSASKLAMQHGGLSPKDVFPMFCEGLRLAYNDEVAKYPSHLVAYRVVLNYLSTGVVDWTKAYSSVELKSRYFVIDNPAEETANV